jgi:hypothetical protein
LANGLDDPHYSLIVVSGEIRSAPIQKNYNSGTWIQDDLISGWVGWSASRPSGENRIRTFFDLGGFVTDSAIIRVRFCVDDNTLNVILNGVPLNLTGGSRFGFSPFYTINQGFVSGINTLDFSWNNIGGRTGFRAQVSGTAVPL